MAIAIDEEQLLDLHEAAAALPGRPHRNSVWRWCQRGVRGVRLEYLIIGNTPYTSREALQRFADRLTAQREGQTAPSDHQSSRPARTRRQRSAAAAAAKKALSAG